MKMAATEERMRSLGLLTPMNVLTLDEWEISRDRVVMNRKLGDYRSDYRTSDDDGYSPMTRVQSDPKFGVHGDPGNDDTEFLSNYVEAGYMPCTSRQLCDDNTTHDCDKI